MNIIEPCSIVCKAVTADGTSAVMTKPATFKLTMVLFSTLAVAGCGTDPYAGETTLPGSGANTGTGGASGGGGATTPTGGTMAEPDASTAGPDVPVGSPDAPSGPPAINYKISISPTRLLDLVFMIDNSPSMAPKVAKMNAQLPKLIAASVTQPLRLTAKSRLNRSPGRSE